MLLADDDFSGPFTCYNNCGIFVVAQHVVRSKNFVMRVLPSLLLLCYSGRSRFLFSVVTCWCTSSPCVLLFATTYCCSFRNIWLPHIFFNENH